MEVEIARRSARYAGTWMTFAINVDADDAVIPGSRHAHPERIEDWAGTIDLEHVGVIYCVRGGSVSQSVSASLIRPGFGVRYVEDGIAAWKAQGGIGHPKRPA